MGSRPVGDGVETTYSETLTSVLDQPKKCLQVDDLFRWLAMAESGHRQFSEIIERTEIPAPTITTPVETEQVVLEQHTETGEYRVRPINVDIAEAADE